jgi:hypothetical protein
MPRSGCEVFTRILNHETAQADGVGPGAIGLRQTQRSPHHPPGAETSLSR